MTILLFVMLLVCSANAQSTNFLSYEAKRANIKIIKNDSLLRVTAFNLLKSKEKIELTKTRIKKISGGGAYYLTHYVGDGTNYQNRQRPYLSDGISGWASVDIREATKGNDVMVWYPSIISDPRLIFLGQSKDDTLSQQARNILESKLGKLELKKVENVIAEILLKNFAIKPKMNGELVIKLKHTTTIPKSKKEYLKWKKSILR